MSRDTVNGLDAKKKAQVTGTQAGDLGQADWGTGARVTIA